MKFYHRTTRSAAASILSGSFKDCTGTYLTDEEFTGVWLSADFPLDANEGASGDVVLEVEAPEAAFVAWEWVEEDEKPYREFLVPAVEVNRYPVRSVDEDELGLIRERHPRFKQ